MNKSLLKLETNSDIAKEVDNLLAYLNYVSLFFIILVSLLVLVFIIKYRRKSDADRPQHINESKWVEIIGSVVPFFLFMSMFAWGAKIFYANATVPDDAMEIFVTGKQWMWKVQHPNGKREINDLHVPAGVPVKITLSSEDVIHSYYIPMFRTKKDAVPGRYTQMWFKANKPSSGHIFCAEYCGTEHSRMIGTIFVMEPSDYQAWVTGEGASANMAPDPEKGKAIFTANGCVACHIPQAPIAGVAPPLLGPSMLGAYGTKRKMANGEEVLMDDNYIRESIMNPIAKLREGYQPIMPVFKGIISDADVSHVIAYIKSLSDGPSTNP